MGSRARIVVYGPDADAAALAAAAAFAEIAALEAVLSDYRPDSEVARLRTAPVAVPTRISPDLAAALAAAEPIVGWSGGAFDPTIGPLTLLWRADRASGVLSPEDVRATARASVGFGNLGFDPAAETVTPRVPGMSLDFGGIGKGLAARRALEQLRALGFAQALVDLGGDLALGAAPPGRTGWEVQVRTGLAGDAGRRTLTLTECGVATSGDAERWVEFGGRRLSHVLDPGTGLGLDVRRAVTVVHPDPAVADGLATAVSVLGDARAAERDWPGAQIWIVEWSATE
jgi:thiamine biosynthesis lipoprotein